MNSAWWWFDKAQNGSLGRRAKRVTSALALTGLLIAAAHHPVAVWLFRSRLAFESHELMEWLQPMINGLMHFHVAPMYPHPAPSRDAEVTVPADGKITRQEFESLVAWAGDLLDDAHRCAETGSWRAAFILCGATVEAGLVATIRVSEPELRQLGALPEKVQLSNLGLAQLIQVARTAGWLPSVLNARGDESEALFGEIGDAIRFLVKLRNVAAHPSAHVRDLPWLDFKHQMMADWFAVCDGIAAQVFERLASVTALLA